MWCHFKAYDLVQLRMVIENVILFIICQALIFNNIIINFNFIYIDYYHEDSCAWTVLVYKYKYNLNAQFSHRPPNDNN